MPDYLYKFNYILGNSIIYESLKIFY